MNLKHGKYGCRLYRIWQNMKNRCRNSNSNRFQYYAGKGISVCSEWENDFQSFYDWSIANGYSDELTLDRIESEKGYCPENCRWVTYQVQEKNKACVPKYEYDGVIFCQSEVLELFGVKRTTFQARIKRGWSVEEAIGKAVHYG